MVGEDRSRSGRAGDREFLTLRDAETPLTRNVLLPDSDIDAHIEFSYLRSLAYLIGILLVLTDIPRTGLSIDLKRLYAATAPSTVMYYGPYEYPVAHLVRDGDTVVNGSCDGSPIDALEVWSYKFDTLSIPPRAMAKHLGLASFPRCLLYEHRCATSTLPLDTVFHMLDELVTTLRATRFGDDASTRPFRVLTHSNWIDRLHHRIVSLVSRYQDHRMHTFHYFTVPRRRTAAMQICAARRSGTHERPPICSHPNAWRCADPFDADSARTVQIWDHVQRRVDDLRDRYPALRLDLLLTTTQIWATRSKPMTLPNAYFLSDNVEMTTVIRGQRCAPSGACETVMIDEYRYERATLETNVDDWRLVTSALRAASQVYIWLRVVLLCWGCYRARSAESRLRRRPLRVKLLAAVKTFFRVPSHVVIYTNWLAVSGYALAHFIDSSVVHLVSDAFWSTLNGFVAFNLTEYITFASVQMRNVWLVAVFWKAVIVLHSAVWLHPGTQWRPQLGVFSVRSIFLSTVSFLTVFSFYPSRQFRDTNVVLIEELPRVTPRDASQVFRHAQTTSEFGFRLDMKTTLIATALLATQALIVQGALRLLTRRQSRFATCRSFYVPLSAGVLWPASMLHVFWFLPIARSKTSLLSSLRRSNSIRHSWRHVVASTVAPPSPPKPGHPVCRVCSQPVSLLHWRRTQGCWRHEPIFDLDCRTREVWSMVRLVNIGLMSDPIVLAQLYLVGRPIGLSVITPRQMTSRVAAAKPLATLSESQSQRSEDGRDEVVPARSSSSVTMTRRETFIILLPIGRDGSLAIASRQRVGSVCSATVPWHALVNCG
ncbi:hypothetical protein P43SY_004046 [Pythium insidiosum]|uniref:Transmembrane protein n=1 Tax=Pythium insidiosum TaxID=114742 RepID=A0AAD5LVM8_PYTIN|nr:hypothetical protein P43SY_004046 [Pythium insidiosum]